MNSRQGEADANFLKSITLHEDADEAVDMPTLIERTIATGKPSVVFPLREYWIDVGRLDDLQRASDEFQRIFG